MDKNKIHIDDLVRRRLTGAEEPERPGSWLSMRELLDKELPARTTAFNWRRLLGFTAAALLATSIGVGGYHFYTSHQDGQLGAGLDRHTAGTGKAHSAARTTGNASGSGRTAAVIAAAENRTAGTPAQAVPDHAAAATGLTAANHTHTAAAAQGAAHAIHHTVQSSAATEAAVRPTSGTAAYIPHPTGAAGNTSGTATARSAADHQPAVRSGSAAATTAALVKEQRTQTANVPAILSGNSAAAQKAQEPASLPVLASGALSGNTGTAPAWKEAAVPELNNNGGAASAADHTATLIPASGSAVSTGNSMVAPAGAMSSIRPAIAAASGQAVIRRRDTIQQIEIAHRRVLDPVTQKMKYRTDTISRNSVVVERDVPAGDPAYISQLAVASAHEGAHPARLAAASEAAPVPQAAAAAGMDAAGESNLVSLSNFRVSSKLRNLWNAEKFSNFVQQVNLAIARMQFYGGITGGFNATMTSLNTLAGFQLGLTGLLTFNERWSLAGDLKFYQRFASGTPINDNYMKAENFRPGNISVINGTEYRQYTWDEDKVTHYYNYTAVQTVELPLALRYNFNRVFAEAGLNMMYAFRISAEEIDRPEGNPATITKLIPVNTTPEGIGVGRPQVRPEDFNARFGLGYVLGAGYQFSPALNAGFRLVQNFWDNAASDGGRKVSRNLYQTPSIQLSVGYRFSQNRRR